MAVLSLHLAFSPRPPVNNIGGGISSKRLFIFLCRGHAGDRNLKGVFRDFSSVLLSNCVVSVISTSIMIGFDCNLKGRVA